MTSLKHGSRCTGQMAILIGDLGAGTQGDSRSILPSDLIRIWAILADTPDGNFNVEVSMTF